MRELADFCRLGPEQAHEDLSAASCGRIDWRWRRSSSLDTIPDVPDEEIWIIQGCVYDSGVGLTGSADC